LKFENQSQPPANGINLFGRLYLLLGNVSWRVFALVITYNLVLSCRQGVDIRFLMVLSVPGLGGGGGSQTSKDNLMIVLKPAKVT
jgi:hypothetical protein